MSDEFKQAALDYHEFPRPGKLEITRFCRERGSSPHSRVISDDVSGFE